MKLDFDSCNMAECRVSNRFGTPVNESKELDNKLPGDLHRRLLAMRLTEEHIELLIASPRVAYLMSFSLGLGKADSATLSELYKYFGSVEYESPKGELIEIKYKDEVEKLPESLYNKLKDRMQSDSQIITYMTNYLVLSSGFYAFWINTYNPKMLTALLELSDYLYYR